MATLEPNGNCLETPEQQQAWIAMRIALLPFLQLVNSISEPLSAADPRWKQIQDSMTKIKKHESQSFYILPPDYLFNAMGHLEPRFRNTDEIHHIQYSFQPNAQVPVCVSLPSAAARHYKRSEPLAGDCMEASFDPKNTFDPQKVEWKKKENIEKWNVCGDCFIKYYVGGNYNAVILTPTFNSDGTVYLTQILGLENISGASVFLSNGVLYIAIYRQGQPSTGLVKTGDYKYAQIQDPLKSGEKKFKSATAACAKYLNFTFLTHAGLAKRFANCVKF